MDSDGIQTAQQTCGLTVFHDGSCALCQREIAVAKRVTDGTGVTFVDVSDRGHDEVAPGLTGDVAMRRFHVRHADGTYVSGARAFIALWSQSARLSWLARVSDYPLAIRMLDVFYGGLLIVRPPLSKLLRFVDQRRGRQKTDN